MCARTVCSGWSTMCNRKQLKTDEKSAANCHRARRSCLPAPDTEIQRSTAGYGNAKDPGGSHSHSPGSPRRTVMWRLKGVRTRPAAVQAAQAACPFKRTIVDFLRQAETSAGSPWKKMPLVQLFVTCVCMQQCLQGSHTLRSASRVRRILS